MKEIAMHVAALGARNPTEPSFRWTLSVWLLCTFGKGRPLTSAIINTIAPGRGPDRSEEIRGFVNVFEILNSGCVEIVDNMLIWTCWNFCHVCGILICQSNFPSCISYMDICSDWKPDILETLENKPFWSAGNQEIQENKPFWSPENLEIFTYTWTCGRPVLKPDAAWTMPEPGRDRRAGSRTRCCMTMSEPGTGGGDHEAIRWPPKSWRVLFILAIFIWDRYSGTSYIL